MAKVSRLKGSTKEPTISYHRRTMTDKQMIIDVVDVSGCKYLMDDKCLILDMVCSVCSNCYYKQLKRKEQEVQQAMDNYVQLDLQRVKEYNELVDLYKAKEQECEKLKAKLTDIVSSYMDDFTGYNKELGGFDIVLCVKEYISSFNTNSFNSCTLSKQSSSSL